MSTTTGQEHNLDYIPQRLNVSSDQERAFSAALKKLHREAPASLVLLADRNGNILYVSEGAERSKMSELGALLAGDLAANEEIARLTGTLEEQQIILREGQHVHSFMSDVGAHLVLFVQTASEVPLGWSRLLVQETAQQIAALFPEEAAPAAKRASDSDRQAVDEQVEQAIEDLWN